MADLRAGADLEVECADGSVTEGRSLWEGCGEPGLRPTGLPLTLVLKHWEHRARLHRATEAPAGTECAVWTLTLGEAFAISGC